MQAQAKQAPRGWLSRANGTDGQAVRGGLARACFALFRWCLSSSIASLKSPASAHTHACCSKLTCCTVHAEWQLVDRGHDNWQTSTQQGTCNSSLGLRASSCSTPCQGKHSAHLHRWPCTTMLPSPRQNTLPRWRGAQPWATRRACTSCTTSTRRPTPPALMAAATHDWAMAVDGNRLAQAVQTEGLEGTAKG